MKTLSVPEPTHGFHQPTATLTTKAKKEFWLGNPMAEIKEAMAEGVPFTAHYLKAMKPYELIVNPAEVSTIEEMAP